MKFSELYLGPKMEGTPENLIYLSAEGARQVYLPNLSGKRTEQTI